MHEFKFNIASRLFANIWQTKGHLSPKKVLDLETKNWTIALFLPDWLTIYHFAHFQPPGMQFSLTTVLCLMNDEQATSRLRFYKKKDDKIQK